MEENMSIEETDIYVRKTKGELKYEPEEEFIK
jgi:hypothetical protein